MIYYKDKKKSILFTNVDKINGITDIKLQVYKPDGSKLNTSLYSMSEIWNSWIYEYKDFTPDTLWNYIFEATSISTPKINGSWVWECVEDSKLNQSEFDILLKNTPYETKNMYKWWWWGISNEDLKNAVKEWMNAILWDKQTEQKEVIIKIENIIDNKLKSISNWLTDNQLKILIWLQEKIETLQNNIKQINNKKITKSTTPQEPIQIPKFTKPEKDLLDDLLKDLNQPKKTSNSLDVLLDWILVNKKEKDLLDDLLLWF